MVPTFWPTVAGSTQPENVGVGVGAGVGATVGASNGVVVGNEVGAACAGASAATSNSPSLPVHAATTIVTRRTSTSDRRCNTELQRIDSYGRGVASAASTSDHSAKPVLVLTPSLANTTSPKTQGPYPLLTRATASSLIHTVN